MLKFIFKNILLIIPTLLGVVFIVFTINYFTPGDPVVLMLGADYTEEQYEATAAELGVDQPFFVQFYNYVKGIVTKLDFGTSYKTKLPIMNDVADRLPVTLKLGLLTCLVTIVVGIPFGIISATKQYSIFDYIVTFISLFFSSVPGFWFSMMLILLFSLKLNWLPASGIESWKSYVMPVIGGSVSSIAMLTRQTRSSMLEVIRQDYIRTARAKGVSERVVIWRHALRNALIPVVTIVGMQLGTIMGGSAIIETIHSFPGMGTLLLTAINGKDYPTIQTIVLLLAAIICLMNVLVDIAYGIVDPRIRIGGGKKRAKKQ